VATELAELPPLKGSTMRTSSILASSFVLVGFLAACSDGSGLIPPTSGAPGGTSSGGSGDVPAAGTSPVSTAGSMSTGGTGSPIAGTTGDGGSGTLGGSSTGGSSAGGSSAAGSSAGGVMSGGGSGGTTGGGTTGGSGGSGGSDAHSGPFKILVLSTALQYPHDSIPSCALMVGVEGAFDFIKNGAHFSGPDLRHEVEVTEGRMHLPSLGVTPDAMMPMGTKPGSQWTAVLAKNDLSDFTDDNLKNYAMVFSCNPTGTVFSQNPYASTAVSATAMMALQKFVEGGGAWAGLHSATDFENSNGFPWFTNTLAGGYFNTHDGDGTNFTVQVDPMFATHPIMRGIPATWSTVDEWYHMNHDIAAPFQVLQRLASDNRPVTWIRQINQGRMFYTIRGHNMDRFDKEPLFRQLILNGILWAAQRLN